MKIMNKIFLFTGIVLLLSACKNDMEEVARFVKEGQAVIETAREVEILYSDSAVVRVNIKAPLMLVHLDRTNPRKEFPEGVNVDFFDSRHQPQSRLSANYAEDIERKGMVILRDSVVVWNNIGEKLEAEELIWEEDKERIYSDKYVKVSTPDEIVYGTGFESNIDFTRWKIKKVKGRVRVDDIMGEE